MVPGLLSALAKVVFRVKPDSRSFSVANPRMGMQPFSQEVTLYFIN